MLRVDDRAGLVGGVVARVRNGFSELQKVRVGSTNCTGRVTYVRRKSISTHRLFAPLLLEITDLTGASQYCEYGVLYGVGLQN